MSRSIFYPITKRLSTLTRTVRNLGFLNTPRFLLYQRVERFRSKRAPRGEMAPYPLRSQYLSFPVACRPYSSDIEVFRQILVQRDYARLDDVVAPFLIIDCGANVGYSSAYFLSHFPTAHVIAIEPDTDNFALLQRNLMPFGDRAHTINAAIWSHPTRLAATEPSRRDGREWARCFEERNLRDESCVEAISLEAVLEGHSDVPISILKVDIEGAEAALFSESCRSWINRVENIAIELHGKECRDLFMDAIKGTSFIMSQSGDVTICRRDKGVES